MKKSMLIIGIIGAIFGVIWGVMQLMGAAVFGGIEGSLMGTETDDYGKSIEVGGKAILGVVAAGLALITSVIGGNIRSNKVTLVFGLLTALLGVGCIWAYNYFAGALIFIAGLLGFLVGFTKTRPKEI